MKEWFTPTRISIPNTLIPNRSEWFTKIHPALKQAKLNALVNAAGGKPSRREIIELRAGRSKPHRRTQELLELILKKVGFL
jgi:hypothetical protein